MRRGKPEKLILKNAGKEELNFFFLTADSDFNILRMDRRATRVFGRGMLGKNLDGIKCPRCGKRLFRAGFSRGGGCDDQHFQPRVFPLAGGRREFLVMIEDLQKREKAISEKKFFSLEKFAGGVTHDINNILSAVNSSLFIMKQSPFFEQFRDEIGNLEQAAEDLSFVSKNFLLFAQRKVMKLGVVPLKTFFGELCEDADFKIKCRLGAACRRRIRADRVALKNAFETVLAEARRLSRSDKMLLECLGPEKGMVRIEVSSSGLILNRKQRNSFFEPYSNLTDSKTKFALSSAYGIIRQHKGEISIYSDEKNRTRIRIDLPAVR